MRRAILWLILAGIVGGTAWTFFEWLKPASKTADPWSAVPSESAVILELTGGREAWTGFTGVSQIWGAVSDRKGALALDSLVARVLRSVTLPSAAKPPLFALLRRGESTGWLGVIAGPSDDREAPWPQLLGVITGNPSDAAGRTFNPEEVFEATPSPDLHAVSVLWTKGLLLVGSDAGMIEEARLQLKSGGSLVNDTAFARAHGTLGDGADAHLLVQPARLSRLLGMHLQRNTADALAWPEGWAALDIHSKPDALLLSGLLMPSTSNATLGAIGGQGIGHNGVLRVLPSNTHLLQVQNISDAQRWLTDQGIAGQRDGLHADALFHWVQGSLAFATTMLGDTSTADYVILQAGDPGAAEKALLGLCGATGCDTTAYRSVRMYVLPVQEPFSGLLGAPFDAITTAHWCMLGDKVVMANDRTALERSIDAWTDGTSLAADAGASAFFESLAAETSRTYWCNIGASSAWMKKHLNTESTAQWHSYESAIAQFSGFALQLSPGQHGFHHINVRLQHGGAPSAISSGEVAGRSLWKVTLRAAITAHPHLVHDHTTGTRYVLAQDTDNGLTAVSSTGKVMWRRELEGPIMGEVEQVDRFKNGKLQLLFNTAHRIYMIDRNGKDVDGWPVTVKDKASGPLAVFDYEGNKDYRILVPTEEAGLLNVMPDGKPVVGWAPTRMTSVSDGPVRHLRVKNNDYLLVVDHNGNVLLLDRKGAPRHTAKLKLPRNASVAEVRMGIGIGACAIVWVDSSGSVMSGTIDGVVSELAPASTGIVAIGDPSGDGSAEIIRTLEDKLTVTGAPASSFTHACGCALEGPARVVPIGKSRYGIAVACANGEHLWLFDGTGASLPGTPLTGGKHFAVGDINKDGSVEVVVGAPDGSLTAVPLMGATP